MRDLSSDALNTNWVELGNGCAVNAALHRVLTQIMVKELKAVVFLSPDCDYGHLSQKDMSKEICRLLGSCSGECFRGSPETAVSFFEARMREVLSRECGFVAVGSEFDGLNGRLKILCKLAEQKLPLCSSDSEKAEKLEEILSFGRKECLAFINKQPEETFVDRSRERAKRYVENKLGVMANALKPVPFPKQNSKTVCLGVSGTFDEKNGIEIHVSK